MAILGVDPGLHGGLALRGRDYVMVEPMPVLNEALDLVSLRRWLVAHAQEIEIALVEQQGVRPKQDPHSGFKTGVGFGCLVGLLAALQIRYQIVRPQDWSKEFEHGVTEKEDKTLRYRLIKQARKRIAGELFPKVDLRETERSRTPHEGMTDALLIAEYGHRQRKRGNA